MIVYTTYTLSAADLLLLKIIRVTVDLPTVSEQTRDHVIQAYWAVLGEKYQFNPATMINHQDDSATIQAESLSDEGDGQA